MFGPAPNVSMSQLSSRISSVAAEAAIALEITCLERQFREVQMELAHANRVATMGNFGVDAFAEGHVSQSDLHNSTTSNSLTSQHCATFLVEFVRWLARHLYVQPVFQLDRRLRKQQENVMTSFKVVALALLSATASTPAKRRGDSPDGPRPVPNWRIRVKKAYAQWPVCIPQTPRPAVTLTVRSAAKTVCSTSS